VERIREDLFCLQCELEKLEIVETALSGDEHKRGLASHYANHCKVS
jgi:hypothetical protein